LYRMKKLFFLFAVVSFLAACSGPKGMVKIEPNGSALAVEDSVAYELIVFDTEFELNHKLFYYFQYVEHVLRIPILPNPPVGVIY